MDISTRRGFLNFAATFEGAVLLIGLGLGWWTGLLTPRSVHLNWPDLVWGLLGVVPMLGGIFFATGLRKTVTEMLGASLATCRLGDLAALALLAGLGEEILFRGVLEPWIGGSHPWLGLLVANVLFGLAHALNWQYFLFALVTGLYMSLLHRGWPGLGGSLEEPNLLRPIVAHAVYDFIAFLVLVRDYRQTRALPPAPTDDV